MLSIHLDDLTHSGPHEEDQAFWAKLFTFRKTRPSTWPFFSTRLRRCTLVEGNIAKVQNGYDCRGIISQVQLTRQQKKSRREKKKKKMMNNEKNDQKQAVSIVMW